MNDDPGSAKDLIDTASQHSGWVVSVAVGTWAIVLRWLLGRHDLRERERNAWIVSVDERLAEGAGQRVIIMQTQGDMLRRLKEIERRSHNRRKEDDDERD